MKHHFHFLIQFLFASAAVALGHSLLIFLLSFRAGEHAWPSAVLFLALALLFCVIAAGVRAIPAKRHLGFEGKIITGTFFMAIAGGLTLFWLNIFSAVEKPHPASLTWEQQQAKEREVLINERLAAAEKTARAMRSVTSPQR